MRILILGGGFGGVYTALELARLARRRRDVEVLLVSQDNYFFFTPFLTEVAGGGPTGVELATDLHDFITEGLLPEYPELRRDEVRVVLAEAKTSILERFAPRLIELAIRKMVEKGVDVRLGHAIESFDGRA